MYCVYMLSNRGRSVLYTGVTNNLHRRLAEHRAEDGASFVARYRVYELVYIEAFDDVNDAIAREKQIKAGSRRKKDQLVETLNPDWNDLSEDAWRIE